MAVITCKIPEDLDKRLSVEAENRRVPKSEIIRQALETALADSRSSGTTLYDLMKGGVGCIDSGVSDLATNKEHLAGYGGK